MTSAPALSTSFSKPSGKKRALLIAVRHVHRDAGSSFGNLANLQFAHRDAEELRDSLIASHGYQADDIILMKDEKNHPKDLWPTHGRILRQIDHLTSDAPEDCHFFFYFSGHGLQVDASSADRASMRADGREEEIVTADGTPILDYILHDRLIQPLQKVKGSKLFALFDCCHSETLLDLQSGNEPNRYSRAWNIGPGQMFKDLAIVFANHFKLSKKYCKRHKNVPRRSSSGWLSPPTCKIKDMEELSVICLSACRDRQLARDDRELGLTFTKCFLDAMVARPGITWIELHEELKRFIADMQRDYEESCQQDSISDSDNTHDAPRQEPRLRTSSRTDLTQPVSL